MDDFECESFYCGYCSCYGKMQDEISRLRDLLDRNTKDGYPSEMNSGECMFCEEIATTIMWKENCLKAEQALAAMTAERNYWKKSSECSDEWLRSTAIDREIMKQVGYAQMSSALDKRVEELAALQKQNEAMREAMLGLVVKLDCVHQDNDYLKVWSVAQIVMGPYQGRNYVKELDKARQLLTKSVGEKEK